MSDRSQRRLRPARFDDLGLRYALADRLLPSLVGAMAFLAALAVAGAVAASGLAAHWRAGADAVLTVQVPRPADPIEGPGGAAGADRADAVAAALAAAPGVASVHRLTGAELSALLRPWLGRVEGFALPLPAVFELHPASGRPDLSGLAAELGSIAPGTLVEQDDAWFGRLSALARSLQACAAVALLLVAGVAAAVVAIATRAGLAARRQAVDIVHGLGATDGFIAGRFARRATLLAGGGGLGGAALALPVVVGLSWLAAPFAGPVAAPTPVTPLTLPGAELLLALPPGIWIGLAALPLSAAAIGWATAQGTVRAWLRRLP